MANHVTERWGSTRSCPSLDTMRWALADLDAEDDEHPDVLLQHESGKHKGGGSL